MQHFPKALRSPTMWNICKRKWNTFAQKNYTKKRICTTFYKKNKTNACICILCTTDMKETLTELLFNHFNEILGVFSSDVLLFVFTAFIMRPPLIIFHRQKEQQWEENSQEIAKMRELSWFAHFKTLIFLRLHFCKYQISEALIGVGFALVCVLGVTWMNKLFLICISVFLNWISLSLWTVFLLVSCCLG